MQRVAKAERNLNVKITTASSLTDIRRHTNWRCSRWHHWRTGHRCKACRGRWRVSLSWIEHGHPTGWRWLWHARGHTHPHGGHWNADRHGSWWLHLGLHGHGRETRGRGRWRGQCTSKLALVRAREAGYGLHSAVSCRGWTWCQWKRIVLSGLRCQQSFGGRAVTLALSVLFEGVLDCDGLVHEELPVHGLDGRISRFKVGVGHESVALRLSRLCVARDLNGWVSKGVRDEYHEVRACRAVVGRKSSAYLGGRRHHTERAERVVKQPFIDVLIQRSDKQIRTHVELLLIRGGLRYGRTKYERLSRVPHEGARGDLSRTLLTRMGLPHNFI